MNNRHSLFQVGPLAVALVALGMGCAPGAVVDHVDDDGGSAVGGTNGTGGTGGAGGSKGKPPVTGTGGQAGKGGAGGGGGTGGTGGTTGDPTPDPNAVVKSAGCVDGEGLSEGNGTIEINGADRKYVMRLPEGYTRDKAWPLVFALHPNGGNTGYWDSTSGDRALRPLVKDKAILVLGQARTGDWREEKTVDLDYFDKLITRVKTSLCVDTKRIFSMGFSGGGSYSGMLGCHRDDIRAIAIAGAVKYFEDANCVGKPAVWVAIGKEEESDSRLGTRDFWRERAECTDMSEPVEPSPCVAYMCPHEETPVHFCSHPAGHEWPDFGTEAAWNFFAQF